MIFLTAIAFILIFSFLIFIHELGHFTAAKKSGVKVEEFGFGLPPRMWGVQKGETLYSINWIPFGGFVRMLGEDSTDPKARKNKRSFVSQSLWKQTFIVTAGVIMNFLLAFLLLTFGFVIGMEPLIVNEADFHDAIKDGTVHVEVLTEDEVPTAEYLDTLTAEEKAEMNPITMIPRLEVLTWNGGAELEVGELLPFEEGVPDFSDTFIYVDEVIADGFAFEAGLLSGDEVLTVNGATIDSVSELIEATQSSELENENGESIVEFEVLRGGESFTLISRLDEDHRVGIQLSDGYELHDGSRFGISYFPHEITEIERLKYGWKAPLVATSEMWRLSKLTAASFVSVLGDFVTGQKLPDNVAGPVGIAQMTYYTLLDGFAALIRFVAMLSLSLGVINILPFPALDGGRLLFIIVEGLTGKKPSPKWEQMIHSAGFVFLLLFIAYITFNDVLKLF